MGFPFNRCSLIAAGEANQIRGQQIGSVENMR